MAGLQLGHQRATVIHSSTVDIQQRQSGDGGRLRLCFGSHALSNLPEVAGREQPSNKTPTTGFPRLDRFGGLNGGMGRTTLNQRLGGAVGMSEHQKPCQSPAMANGRCRILGGTSPGMIALLANLILFSTLITIFPARADCNSSIEDARSIARNIVVSIDAKMPVPAGTPIQIAWSYKNSAEFHHPQV